MAYLHRLIRKALFVVLALVHLAPAQAATVAAIHYYGAQWNPSFTLQYGTDPLEQCNNLYAQRLAAGVSPLSGTITVSGLTCSKGGTGLGGLGEWWSCPSGSGDLNPTTHVCTVSASADSDCKALADGLNYLKAPLVHYGTVGLTACFAGFVIAGSGGASGGGQSELYGPFACSGTTATLCSTVPKPSSIVVTCKAGEYPGTVNGVQVCVPPSSSVDTPKTTTATPPSPGASAPQIPDAPAGTTSTSEQTICTGSSCSTTTTYKDSSGNPLGSKIEQESKAGYCAENPKAPGCDEDKSFFGGNCSGGFTYEGDAIQGAIAAEVYRQNCLMNQTTDESTLYTTEKAKTGDQTGTLPGNQTVTVSPGDFNSSDAIGGAACITDKTIVVWGKTVVMPFSTVCPALGYLKNILLAVSYLAAAGIVVGRKA